MIKIVEIIFRTDTEELPGIIRGAVRITIFAIFAGFIINIFHPGGFILTNKAAGNNGNIIMISSEEAKIKLESESAVFIDSRQDDEYELSHIPNSINIPATPASIALKKIKENFSKISGPKELVLYCDGFSCGSSQILAEKLIELGYSRHIYIIEKGIPDWKEKGFILDKADEEGKYETN